MKPRRLVVAHVSIARHWGGAEEYMAQLLVRLPRERIQPLVAAPAALLAAGAARWPEDIARLAVELRPPLGGGAVFRLSQWLRRQRVDVLHTHMFRASVCAVPAATLAGVAWIVETPHLREAWRESQPHAPGPGGAGIWKRSYFWDRVQARLVDRYIAVSQANAAYLLERKRLPAAKVVTIRNGCDLAYWKPRPRRACWPRDWGWSENDPLLVQVGRLEPQKGHAVLLEAMPRLWQRVPRLRLALVGEGSMRRELEARIARLQHPESVRLVGYLPDPRDWLAAAWVSVLPSWFEGLPLAALESLAMSRPVVASDVDGIPEVVRHGINGFLAPPGNTAALAEAIAELLGTQEGRERMGAAGRTWVAEHFDLAQQVEETACVYEQALHPHTTCAGLRQAA